MNIKFVAFSLAVAQVFSGPGLAQPSDFEMKHETCMHLSDLASATMAARQRLSSAREIDGFLKRSYDEVDYLLSVWFIPQAMTCPVLEGNARKDIAVSSFGADVYTDCMDAPSLGDPPDCGE